MPNSTKHDKGPIIMILHSQHYIHTFSTSLYYAFAFYNGKLIFYYKFQNAAVYFNIFHSDISCLKFLHFIPLWFYRPYNYYDNVVIWIEATFLVFVLSQSTESSTFKLTDIPVLVSICSVLATAIQCSAMFRLLQYMYPAGMFGWQYQWSWF